MTSAVVVPWAREEQRDAFLRAWDVPVVPDWLVMQRDANREGCGVTKNKGIAEAMRRGAETVVILDDDCFPYQPNFNLQQVVTQHRDALTPQPVQMFEAVTDPPSRGTPYAETMMTMPVAASMGFWMNVGDYCAVRQLVHGATHPMRFQRRAVFGRYFPLCGMNLAFNPGEWLPWCKFIDVPRYDDIWMGWLWQREAYRRKFCFNLAGPLVTHSRQSNVWQNLRDESAHAERNETLWRDIAACPRDDHASLSALLPLGTA